MSSENLIYIKVNDIFDELREENHRLYNELIFAQKSLIRLKDILNKINDKYSQLIDIEDKQELIGVQTSLQSIGQTSGQSFSLTQLLKSVQNELNIRKSNKLIKETILKKYRNKCLKKVIKTEQNSSHGSGEDYSDEGLDQRDYSSGGDNDEDIETLRQLYIKREGIYDPKSSQFVCPKSGCNKRFEMMKGLGQHLRVVHKIGKIKNEKTVSFTPTKCFDDNSKTFKCPKPKCFKEFNTKVGIYRHLRIVHTTKPKLCCPQPNCGKLLKNNHNMKLHMKTHSLIPEPKPFGCDFAKCEFRSRTKPELIQHMRSHSDEKPFKCSVDDCDKSFKNPRGLREHAFTHYSEPSLECQVEGCHLLFRTVWHRKNHMNVVHFGKNLNDRPPKQCDWPGCDYTTKYAHQINKHKRLHTGEKPYPCDWPACGKRFRLLQQLKDHKNIHNNLKPYVCHWPGCHYRCSDSANLRKHIRTSHSNKMSTESTVNFMATTGVCDQSLTISQ